LRTCRSDPDAHCGAEAQRVADANRRLAVAREARALAEQAVTHLAAAQQRFLAECGARISDGRSLTSRKGADLEAYLRAIGGAALSSAGGRAGTSGSGTSGSGAAGGLPAEVRAAPGLPAGVGLVPLALIDTSRDPVTGPTDFGKGYGPQDLAWAFTAFDEVVLPTLAASGGTDYFAARDAAENRMGTRSFTDTHSGFLGAEEAITLTLRADGRFDVANGRHRIWVAQQLGRDSVPARFA
jgi:hypothetical protein